MDSRGNVTNTEEANGPFEGGVELVRRLEKSREVRSCFVTNWLRFALGRSEAPSEACFVEEMADDFDASGTDIPELILNLVRSPVFVERVRAP
ncbi:MAG: DUF1585 domain-containing protein [Myxococcota bacterium]